MNIKKYMKLPILINQNASFEDALKIMISENTNSLLVVDNGDKLVWGIDVVSLVKAIIPKYIDSEKHTAHFTTDSLFRNCINDAKSLNIKDFMMVFTKVITPHTSMMEAAMMVTEWRQSKIPVLDEQLQPIWIITRWSLKKVLWFELGIITF